MFDPPMADKCLLASGEFKVLYLSLHLLAFVDAQSLTKGHFPFPVRGEMLSLINSW